MDEDFFRQIDKVGELYPPEKLDEDILICECFCVSVADIRRICSSNGIVDLDLLGNSMGFGQGCKSCLKNLEYWIHKIF